MSLPNLLIVGAAKSGTTSLYNYLSQHSDLFASSHKEPHFLINNEIGKTRIPNGITELKSYMDLFLGKDSFKYRVEASTMYLQFPDISIKNIRKYLDADTKIIIMLRNPIDRAFSGYNHVKRYNLVENLSFENALELSEDRYHTNVNITPASRYKNIGLYYEMVKKFMKEFNESLHIIIYDDFISEPQKELDKVCSFLSINQIQFNVNSKYMVGGWQWKSPFLKKFFLSKGIIKKLFRFLFPFSSLRAFLKKNIIRNQTSKVPMMKKATREHLLEYYYNDIVKLSKLLSLDLNKWLK